MTANNSTIKDRKRDKIKRAIIFITWIGIYFIYIVVGGAIITRIEGEQDLESKQKRKQKFISTLNKYNYSINDTAINEIITAAIEAADVIDTPDNEFASSWNLHSGMFFCNTLVTTIGYGNLSPITDSGKVFCIFYPLPGMAITGVVVLKIGQKIAQLIEKSDYYLEQFIISWLQNFADISRRKIVTRATQLFITMVISSTVVWIVPSLLLSHVERWDFLTSTYFCFITLTTIGLGDIVPGDHSKTKIKERYKNFYQNFSMLYILICLATLSTIINIVRALLTSISEAAKMQAECAIYDYLDKINVNGKLKDMLVETNKQKKVNNRWKKNARRINHICRLTPGGLQFQAKDPIIKPFKNKVGSTEMTKIC